MPHVFRITFSTAADVQRDVEAEEFTVDEHWVVFKDKKGNRVAAFRSNHVREVHKKD
jgi:hypothetical protein